MDQINDQLLKIFEFFGALAVKFQFEVFFKKFLLRQKFRLEILGGVSRGCFVLPYSYPCVIGEIEPFVTREKAQL